MEQARNDLLRLKNRHKTMTYREGIEIRRGLLAKDEAFSFAKLPLGALFSPRVHLAGGKLDCLHFLKWS